MHIGFNLVYLVPGETGGTETYARELIPALLAERPDLKITAFVNRETAGGVPGPWNELVSAVDVPVRARRRSEWVRGEQQLLPRLAARAGVDLVHSLANTGPVWGRSRRIVTIHDLHYRLHPETHGRVKARAMGVLVRLAANRSDRIIVSSEATRADLIQLESIPPGKIDLVPFGAGARVVAATAEGELRSRYSLEARAVVLSVSRKRPHKNLDRLLDALALIEPAGRPLLVLPGSPTPHEQELRVRASELGVSNDVRFLGWISPADLEGLYGLAAGVVLPSLHEGFGLPVLEAMSRGVPVASSDRGALAEVAAGAARLFDPERPAEIAGAIRDLVSDPGLRDRLRAAGLERARQYTWSATARGTLLAYERALMGTMTA